MASATWSVVPASPFRPMKDGCTCVKVVRTAKTSTATADSDTVAVVSMLAERLGRMLRAGQRIPMPSQIGDRHGRPNGCHLLAKAVQRHVQRIGSHGFGQAPSCSLERRASNGAPLGL